MADVVTIDQVKSILNKTGTQDDVELQLFLSAAEQMWASKGGPLGTAPESIDEWHNGGAPQIVLRRQPAASIQDVLETTGPVTYRLTEEAPGTGSGAYAYSFTPETGTLTRRASGVAINFLPGVSNVKVTYTPGIAEVPEDIQLAILLLVQHLWLTQRGASRAPSSGGNEAPAVPGAGFSWPYRVLEILRAHTIPGIA